MKWVAVVVTVVFSLFFSGCEVAPEKPSDVVFGAIRGSVSLSGGGSPEGVNVVLLGTSHQARAGGDGAFIIFDIRPTNYTVIAYLDTQYDSYYAISNIIVKPDEYSILNISLVRTNGTPFIRSSSIGDNDNISIVFSEPMEKSATNYFTISPATSGELFWVAMDTLVFKPASALLLDTDYSITIQSNAKSANSIPMKQSYTCWLNKGPLSVVDSTPVNGQEGVSATAAIQLTFNDNMNRFSVQSNIVISNSLGETLTWVPAWNGTVLTVTPSQAMKPNTRHYFCLSAGALNTGGISLLQSYTTCFKTADLTVSTSPMHGAGEVALDTTVSITFGADMDQTSVERNTVLSNASGVKDVVFGWSGNTLTLTPAGNLAGNTRYYLLVGTNSKTADGIGMDTPLSVYFDTRDLISGHTPRDGDLAISLVSPVQITFYSPMYREITAAAFGISPAVSGNISWSSDSKVLTFVPGAAFAPAASYTVTLSTNAVDIYGNRLNRELSYRFDTVSFLVTGGTPVDGQINIPLTNTSAVVEFNHDLDPNIKLDEAVRVMEKGSTNSLPGLSAAMTGTGKITVNWSDGLKADMVYQMVVYSNALRDVYGSILSNDAVFEWKTTVLAASARNILDGQKDVPATTTVQVGFNSVIDSAVPAAEYFLLAGPGTNPVPGIASLNAGGNILTFTPYAGLDSGTVYTVRVATNVRDIMGNHLPQALEYQFTTIDIRVVSNSPGNGFVLVDTGVKPRTIFNQTMDSTQEATNIYRLLDETGSNVAGSFLWQTTAAANDTLRFNPYSGLEVDSVYTILVTTNARNFGGHTLSSNFRTTFRTIPLAVLSSVPTNNSVDVAVRPGISVVFNSSMDQTATQSAFSMADESGIAVNTGGGTFVWSQTAYVDDTLTFTPGGDLNPGTAYTVNVSTNARNKTSKALAAPYSFMFRTFEMGISSTVPSDGSLSGGGIIAVNFNSVMDVDLPATNYFRLFEGTNGVTCGLADFLWNSGSNTLGYHPATGLYENTSYRFVVAGGSNGVKTAGGELLKEDYPVNFQTKQFIVDTTVPANGSTITASAANKKIDITFNTAISNALAFSNVMTVRSVVGGVTNAVAGAFTVQNLDTMLRFTSTLQFPANAEILVDINTNIRSSDNVSWRTDYNFSFFTQ